MEIITPFQGQDSLTFKEFGEQEFATLSPEFLQRLHSRLMTKAWKCYLIYEIIFRASRKLFAKISTVLTWHFAWIIPQTHLPRSLHQEILNTYPALFAADDKRVVFVEDTARVI